MGYILAVLLIAAMLFALFLILPGLPGNWLMIGLLALWAWFSEPGYFGWQYFLFIIVLAVIAEITEFLAGYFGAKRFGGSKAGSYGGIIGAIVGGILGAGFLFGIGALPGALLGCFTGCFIVEKVRNVPTGPAAKAACGATLGRLGGFIVKIGVGITIIWTAIPRIWESI